MPGSKAKFSLNEKVYCFHGPMIYEAKVIKVEKEGEESWKYFIHYQGWNKSWDEWAEESR